MDEMRAFAMLTYNRTLTAKNKAPMIDELRAIVEAAGDQGKAAPAGVSPQVAGGGKGKGKAKPSHRWRAKSASATTMRSLLAGLCLATAS